MRTITILAAAAVLSMVVEPPEARASVDTSPASHFASPPRRETTTEYRIFEADQVFREAPESLLGKPIVTVGIASQSPRSAPGTGLQIAHADGFRVRGTVLTGSLR